MVTQTDVDAAFKKGKISGGAKARANAKAAGGGAPRRRKKYYRMKKFGSSTKQAIGRFQSKHPYLSGAAEGAVIVGGGAGVLQAFGFRAFDFFAPIRRLPVLGKVYTAIANGTYDGVRRLKQ